MLRSLMLTCGLVLAATAVSVPPALQCPDIADAHTATGWQEYRANRLANAHSAFSSGLARCPGHAESMLGLGFVALRNLEIDSARALFQEVLKQNPRHLDALTGLGLAAWRADQFEEARTIFNRVLAMDPDRTDVREHLATLPAPLGPPPVRPALVLPDSLLHFVRTAGDYFEVRAGDGWAPFYIKGVNIGAALPGRYPSEFPEGDVYRHWLADIARMGANTVRVYTLHPPAFYQAFAEYNEKNPDRPLWLLHGVWAELPPRDDYHDAAWKGEFFGEMERVIDALHGRADVMHRPGHAAGYYTADVSRWVLGLILGREWEPYSVAEFNEQHPQLNRWNGRFFRIENAPAMDVWLAEALEHAVAYESDTYRIQRPVAYTNWPTLDPMRHPVEINSGAELDIRGVDYDRTRRQHNEDEVSLGEVPIATTPEYRAGYFAAFHVYPYFPDFFLHDPVYGAVEGPEGRSAYFGYLADLKRHFQGVPLVIAEYGLPASWGIAHFNPQGWHHGGHSEARMAEINGRLTREVAAAGMAGGVAFSWIDEWFKHTWLDQSQEKPAERNRMWWNKMNPEQHYGINAMEPVRRLGETLAERRAAWDTIPALYATADGSSVRMHADEAYLWVQVRGPLAASERFVIGFDIADPAAGALRLEDAASPALPVGVEYVLEVDAKRARMMAAPGVYPFQVQLLPRGATLRDDTSRIGNPPPGLFVGSITQGLSAVVKPRAMDDGRLLPLQTVLNRARVSADSTNYLGMGYDRGVLRPGPLPDGAWERTPQELEFRLPWALVGVTDPSSRHVSYGGGEQTLQVEAIRVVAAAQDARGAWRLWPESGHRADVASFTWPTWDSPSYRARRRPLYDTLRNVFAELQTTPARLANP